MKLDRFFTDLRKTVERILNAFDHNITVQDNFGPSGAPEGHTIVSRGPTLTPIWGPVVAVDDESVSGEAPVQGNGQTGPAGPAGPPGLSDCSDCVAEILSCIVTTDGEVVVSGGNVVWSCDA